MATITTITDLGPVLTPGEVAEALNADPRTVTRWARKGKIRYFTTPGGHRRYFKADVDAILSGSMNGQQYGGAK